MIIGTNCLVCVNGKLILGKVQFVFSHNVVIEVSGEDGTQVVSKENVIKSVSSEAFEAIKEHYELLVK